MPKPLLSAIAKQQAALLLAAVSLLIFLLAPHPDELLNKGQTDLTQLSKQAASVLHGTDREAAADGKVKAALESVKVALDDAKTGQVDAKTARTQGVSVSDSKDDLEPSKLALGIRSPETVKELAKVVDGTASYCEPHPETPVFLAVEKLARLQKVQSIEVKRFIGLWTADGVSLAKATLDKALQVGMVGPAYGQDNADKTQAGAVRKLVKPTPPRDQMVPDPKNPDALIENPKLAVYRQQLAAYNAQSFAQIQSKRRASETNAAIMALPPAFEKLARGALSEPAPQADPPSYVVAKIDLTAGAKDKVRETSLYLPMVCKQVPLADASSERKTGTLEHLRLTPEWEQVGDLNPDAAAEVIKTSLVKQGETLEIGGVKFPESLLTALGPFILFALLVWHLVHLGRLQRLFQKPGTRDALEKQAQNDPSLPCRENFLVPLATAVAVGALSGALALQAKSEFYRDVGWVCVGLSVLMLVIVYFCAPAPREA